MKYQLFIERAAQKELAKLPRREREQIIQSIQGLTDNPRGPGVKKLRQWDAWRLRVGRYRVIYEIHDEKVLVVIVRVRHRRDVYR